MKCYHKFPEDPCQCGKVIILYYMAEITFPQFIWGILTLVAILSFMYYPLAVVELN